MSRHPDVLVLGGGGILGEAWMSSLLAGFGEATGWDPRDVRGFVGTSAGAIVAASLAAGEPPRATAPASGNGDLPPAPASRPSPLGGTLNAGRAAGAALAAPLAAAG